MGRFKGFCVGGWLLGPKGVPRVPVGDPLYEAVQHVSFALFLGEEMPRHCHEGAEEAIQGLAGLLLQECEAVSDG